MRPNVVFVGRRDQVRRELASRLGQLCDTACWGPWRLADVFWSPPRTPRLAIVDVLELFRRVDASLRPPLQQPLPAIVVVGFRSDSTSILAALNEGIPVHILEDMVDSSLAEMVGGGASVPVLYSGMGRLCAERIHAFLRRTCAGPTLTRRESQVLELVRQGYANPEIARILGIDLKTVKNHLTHVYEKLGVSGRYEAITCSVIPPAPALGSTLQL